MPLDKQTFVDTIIEGRGTVANSYINSTIPGWSEEEEAYPYDPEKAKELLAEAGYPNGFECSLYVNGDVRAHVPRRSFRHSSLKLESPLIFLPEWGALLDSLNAAVTGMFILGWSNTNVLTQTEAPTSYSAPRTAGDSATVHS